MRQLDLQHPIRGSGAQPHVQWSLRLGLQVSSVFAAIRLYRRLTALLLPARMCQQTFDDHVQAEQHVYACVVDDRELFAFADG